MTARSGGGGGTLSTGTEDSLGYGAAVPEQRPARQNPEAAAGVLAARRAINDEPVDDIFTSAFADAAVAELGRLIDNLPAKIRDSVAGGRDAAETLSTDPLQGISEVIQNGDDQRASNIRIAIVHDGDQPTLVMAHDGDRVRLEHLVAMVLPWVSTSRLDDRATGRFGIGLSTLRSIGESLEIHCAPYHASLIDGRLRVAAPAPPIPGVYDAAADRPQTLLRIPIDDPLAVSVPVIAEWLRDWGSAGLLFLGSIRSVSLLGDDEEPGVNLSIATQRRRQRVAGNGSAARNLTITHLSDGAGNEWLRYETEFTSPAGMTRAKKRTSPITPVSIAVPVGTSPAGNVHAGLPIQRTQLRWSFCAQFDPDTARGHLRNTDWNQELIKLVARLWAVVLTDLLATRPRDAWQMIPAQDEHVCADEWLTSALAVGLEEAAPQLAGVGVRVGPDLVPLADLVYCDPELVSLLDDSDLRALQPDRVVLEGAARDPVGRWWQGLVTLSLGHPVNIEEAISLLEGADTMSRAPQWLCSLLAVAVRNGKGDTLRSRGRVMLADGRVIPPPLAGRDPVALVSAVDPGVVATRAGLVLPIHPAYLDDNPDAQDALAWLTQCSAFMVDVTPQAVIERVAAAGGGTLSLDDDQLVALRDAFDLLAPDLAEQLGHKVGQSVVLDAESYEDGATVTGKRRPTQCYLHRRIDRDPESWAVAAARTPGLWWVAGRYADVLRHPSGRTGLGPQRFLGLLGVERAPRLLPHPAGDRHYSTDHRRGVSRHAPDAPPTRREELRHAPEATTHILSDQVSPDLEAVLADLGSDPLVPRQHRRAAAVLGTLQRSWERLYADSAQAPAVQAYNQWNALSATVTAWWLASVRDTKWLPDSQGRLCAPRDLVAPTKANREVYGSDGHFADEALLAGTRDDIISALGITGDPRVSDVLTRLREIRDIHDDVDRQADAAAWEETARAAYPMYRILADWLSPARRRRMDLGIEKIRDLFAEGSGLVLSALGWRRPSGVLAGAPVFGRLRAFAPYEPALERLWRDLRIPLAGVDDCLDVLRQVAQAKRLEDAEAIELETLRLLTRLLTPETMPPVGLRRLALRTPHGYTGRRPVYAVDHPVLQEQLADAVSIWTPPGDVRQFSSLYGPLHVIDLPTENFVVRDQSSGWVDDHLSAVASAALGLLLDELARDDPALAATAALPASELTELQVRVHEQVDLDVELRDGAVTVQAPAHLDLPTRTMHLRADSDLADWQVGGRAVSAIFRGDRAKVAYAWSAMWTRAEEGERARAMHLAEQEERARSAELLELHEEIREGKTTRPAKTSGKKTPGSGGSPTTSQTPSPPPSPPRVLIDLSKIVINRDNVVIVNVGDKAEPIAPRGEVQLREPRRTGNGSNSSGSRPTGPPLYTEKQKEKVGFDLLALVLGDVGGELEDLRSQVLVGGDAIDKKDRIYELKVHGGAAPNAVTLTASEVARSRGGKFFLVVVSNVEAGGDPPEVRIIADPVHMLADVNSGALTFSGVRDVEALLCPTSFVLEDEQSA